MKSRPKFVAIMFAGCFTLGLASSLPAAGTGWKAGVARVVITPEQPVPMAGYAARTRPFQEVEHDLFAKAISLEDETGRRALLITTDLVGIPKAIADPILTTIEERTGLRRDRILLSASHTHAGPLLTENVATRYDNIAPEDGRRLREYTVALGNKIASLAVTALANLAPARLAWGQGTVGFAMNRREFTERGVVLGVNPRGLVDRSVPILRVTSPEGKIRAVLFAYACHNTTLTGNNLSLCGDYAGFAQRHIEREHSGCQALFMMGCGGDANPYPRGTMNDARAHGAELGREVCRLLESELRDLAGPLNCALDRVSLPLQSFTPEDLQSMAAEGPSWRRGNAQQLLEIHRQGGTPPSHYESPVSVWRFGSGLTLVGLPGEVVVGYVPLLEKALGPLNLWVAAYCHDVCGYLPTAQVLAEGGYECRGLYTAPGFFTGDLENVLVEAVQELFLRAERTKDPAQDQRD